GAAVRRVRVALRQREQDAPDDRGHDDAQDECPAPATLPAGDPALELDALAARLLLALRLRLTAILVVLRHSDPLERDLARVMVPRVTDVALTTPVRGAPLLRVG